jgi:hypothetical protein
MPAASLTLRKGMDMSVTSNSSCLREDRLWVQASDYDDTSGITVECICPKCGIVHRMKLFWSGRGKPKKYCPPCKGFVSTIEPNDFCGIAADIHRGLEKAV